MLAAINDNIAVAHCLTCAESPHGGWVDGPCSWSGCPFRTPQSLHHVSGKSTDALRSSETGGITFHAEATSAGGAHDHV